MVKYSDEAYNPVMDVYNSIPTEAKETANKIVGDFKSGFPEGEAPPTGMIKKLIPLVPKGKLDGLESAIKKASEFEKKGNEAIAAAPSGFLNIGPRYAALLAAAAAIALMMAGMPPYIP
ncbi:hypothetical protein HYX05_00680 [Candidatus Woesearchaeota archaeon]|nr:hypothetical protein [Candidatus Woesearchaeota archaeon]